MRQTKKYQMLFSQAVDRDQKNSKHFMVIKINLKMHTLIKAFQSKGCMIRVIEFNRTKKTDSFPYIKQSF